MSLYHPICPCPICSSIIGNCEINEYGYALVCYGMPSAQEGDLRGTWKCFRSTGEYSQWKDQRVALEAQYRERKAEITFVDADGKPVDATTALNEIFERLRKKEEHGGEQ